jgi:hypothetical protein
VVTDPVRIPIENLECGDQILLQVRLYSQFLRLPNLRSAAN